MVLEIAQNHFMTSNPLLSVVCVTYNHELYIARAIEGFLMQKTSFPIEIIIGEDCSTDKTREICIEHQRKHPDKIKLLLREKNIGAMENHLSTIAACAGKYIANCEGDDYWTDPLKLQKQVDFLEAHSEFSISSHNVIVMHEGANKPSTEWFGKRKKENMTIEDILSFGGGASCSLVFRNKVFGEFPDWFKEQKGGDWSLQILCASKGKMRYFKEVMGVYRRHGDGSAIVAIKKAEKHNQITFALPAKYSLETSDLISRHFNHKYDRLLRKSNIYWYLYYIKSYLRIYDVKSARAWALKVVTEVYDLRFWNIMFVYPRMLPFLFLTIMPNFLIKAILKRLY